MPGVKGPYAQADQWDSAFVMRQPGANSVKPNADGNARRAYTKLIAFAGDTDRQYRPRHRGDTDRQYRPRHHRLMIHHPCPMSPQTLGPLCVFPGV